MKKVNRNRKLIRTILAIFFIIIIIIAFARPSNKTEIIIIVFEPAKVNTDNIVNNTNHRSVTIPQEINADFDILQPCGYTQEQLEQAMQGEYYKKMLPYVGTIVKAEETYGVNALYLLCKFGLESGWGKYMAAENNIGGWTDGNGNYKDFDSVDDCIMYIAESLANVYKDEVGSKLIDVCERYCPENGYMEMLIEIMIECEQRIN